MKAAMKLDNSQFWIDHLKLQNEDLILEKYFQVSWQR